MSKRSQSRRDTKIQIIEDGKATVVEKNAIEAFYCRLRHMSSLSGGAKFFYMKARYPRGFTGDLADIPNELLEKLDHLGESLQVTLTIDISGDEPVCHLLCLLQNTFAPMFDFVADALMLNWHGLALVEIEQRLVEFLPDSKIHEPVGVNLDQNGDRYTFGFLMDKVMRFATEYFSVPESRLENPYYGWTELSDNRTNNSLLPPEFTQYLGTVNQHPSLVLPTASHWPYC